MLLPGLDSEAGPCDAEPKGGDLEALAGPDLLQRLDLEGREGGLRFGGRSGSGLTDGLHGAPLFVFTTFSTKTESAVGQAPRADR